MQTVDRNCSLAAVCTRRCAGEGELLLELTKHDTILTGLGQHSNRQLSRVLGCSRVSLIFRRLPPNPASPTALACKARPCRYPGECPTDTPQNQAPGLPRIQIKARPFLGAAHVEAAVAGFQERLKGDLLLFQKTLGGQGSVAHHFHHRTGGSGRGP